jgi:NAD(P)-dependent dehydrogenase (short-subunit alcohol dehydrogenase family)
MADWAGKRVVVIGLARQGKALARYLSAQGAHVTVTDQKPASTLASAIDELEGLPVEFVLGGHPPTLLEGADLRESIMESLRKLVRDRLREYASPDLHPEEWEDHNAEIQPL